MINITIRGPLHKSIWSLVFEVKHCCNLMQKTLSVNVLVLDFQCNLRHIVAENSERKQHLTDVDKFHLRKFQ